MIDVSVIIPAYNAETTVAACFRALNAQTFPKDRFEVVFVDDGSTDRTLAIAKENAGPDLQVRYVLRDRSKTCGPGISRSEGIALAQGRIIAFTDSDCMVDAGWLTAIEGAIVGKGETLVSGDVWCDEIVLFPWRMAPAGQRNVAANIAFDRQRVAVIDAGRGFVGLVGEDTDFIFRVMDEGHRMAHVTGMRVQHPTRTMTLWQVVTRSRWRKNEVLLFKRHGRKALSSMHPFFQPLIGGKISLATLFMLLSFVAVAVAVRYPASLGRALLLVVAGSVAFVAYFYRFAIMYMPAQGGSVTFGERCKTLLFTVIYLPCFVVARIVGSVQFRFFLL